jgi:ubiquinone/menaquinone biosynthesis C-methylase UbiE
MPEASVFGCFSIGSVAATYEEIYVPRIFIPWARLLVDRAHLKPAETVLDVATGPGTVARLAAERVGRHGRVVGTDISAAMVDLARAKPIPSEAAPIEYLVAPAAPLPVDDGAFDLVTCQQGLQFFPDRRAALREMHRALKPSGRLVAAVWREIAQQPSFAAIDAALRECLSAEAAEPYGAPFRWPSADDLRAALEDGGFEVVVIEEHQLPLIYEGGISQALSTLAASPVATTVAGLAAEDRAQLWHAGERRLQPLVTGTAIGTQMVSHLAIASKR